MWVELVLNGDLSFPSISAFYFSLFCRKPLFRYLSSFFLLFFLFHFTFCFLLFEPIISLSWKWKLTKSHGLSDQRGSLEFKLGLHGDSWIGFDEPLIYTNCVPNLTYAAEVKDVSCREMQNLNTALNDAIHRIFSYRRWERRRRGRSTRQLRQQLRFPKVTEIFQSRRARFISLCAQSDNDVIRFMVSISTSSLFLYGS